MLEYARVYHEIQILALERMFCLTDFKKGKLIQFDISVHIHTGYPKKIETRFNSEPMRDKWAI